MFWLRNKKIKFELHTLNLKVLIDLYAKQVNLPLTARFVSICVEDISPSGDEI